MITHLKIKVLYAVCFLAVSAMKAKMLSMLAFLVYWAPTECVLMPEVGSKVSPSYSMLSVCTSLLKPFLYKSVY